MVGGWPLTIADSMTSISYGMYCIKLKDFREELIIMAAHCQVLVLVHNALCGTIIQRSVLYIIIMMSIINMLHDPLHI